VDVLGDVLSVCGVTGTVAATVDAGEGWGLGLEQVPGAAFHAIATGTAWLRMPSGPAVQLMPGDVVLLPGGAPHRLSGDREGPVIPFDHVAAEQAMPVGGVLQVGAAPVRTRILCASYRQDPAAGTRLFSLLPQVVHVPAGAGGHGALDDTLRLLAAEVAEPQPARAVLLDRLVDILLIQVLRAWLRGAPDVLPASWLGGLSDDVVAPALAALHGDPARDWTVQALAEQAAVSRATLARRFTSVVGEPPGVYLTRWRMDLAARRLRDTDDPVSVVARSVGYTSEYAFSRAFARARSVPPGRYRSSDRDRATTDVPSRRPSSG
jgi:AraC-like DNA-binding protein